MKRFRTILIFCIAVIFMNSKCKKDTPIGEFYFRCKIDGQEYIPNNCANCLSCSILGDTTFLLGANRGFEATTIGIVYTPNITTQTYILNQVIASRGTYKNSTTVNDRYFTDSLRTGSLTISLIDKSNMIVQGTFSFQAYNPVQDTIASVTEGIFRLEYIDH